MSDNSGVWRIQRSSLPGSPALSSTSPSFLHSAASKFRSLCVKWELFNHFRFRLEEDSSWWARLNVASKFELLLSYFFLLKNFVFSLIKHGHPPSFRHDDLEERLRPFLACKSLASWRGVDGEGRRTDSCSLRDLFSSGTEEISTSLSLAQVSLLIQKESIFKKNLSLIF